MFMHHTLDCAKSRLNPESHWLVGWLMVHFCKQEDFVKIMCLV